VNGGWLDEVGDQLRGVADAFWGEVRGSGILPLLQPVPPFDRPRLASPAVAVGGLLAVVLLSGMAIAGLGAMLVALLGLYLVLVELFGLSFELRPLGSFGAR
jgi:hypothetical protein